MILTVRPTDSLKGSVDLPASKSYSIRAFLISSRGGTSTIISPSDCDDAKVAISVARQLGSQIKHNKKNIWTIKANARNVKISDVNVNESGTVLRFILPLLALRKNKIRVIGEGTLKGRPNLFLAKTLRQMGACIRGQGNKESVPIILQGGYFHGGHISIDGSLSSQFISALLTAAPSLKEDTYLKITGNKLVSQPYIVMTENILKQAGIRIHHRGNRLFYIKGNQRFRGLKNFTVPSDYGLAAFFLAAAVLTKSNLILKGYLNNDFIQSDGQILSFLKHMGVQLIKTTRCIKIKGPQRFKGGSFSLKDSPDLLPIMTIMALFAKGKTRLYDIGHARAKESDRLSDLRRELLKVGAYIRERQNELIITPRPSYKKNVFLNPHRDHRLAMSFAVLGLKLGAKIKDIECVNKSYPQFVKDFRKIGVYISKN